MKRDGVKKADIVMFQLFNSTEFLFSYIAPQKLGAICNPVNFNLSAGETAEIMSHNRAKVYLYDSEIADTAVQALAMSEHKPEVVIAVHHSGKPFKLPEGHILFENYVKNADDSDPPIDFAPHIYDEVGAHRHHHEHDAVVPSRRSALRRSHTDALCGRRGGDYAHL